MASLKADRSTCLGDGRIVDAMGGEGEIAGLAISSLIYGKLILERGVLKSGGVRYK